MRVRQRADAIDTRVVFRAYAVLAGLTGLVLIAWGPAWLSSDNAGFVRLLGSMVIAAGCLAAALAGVEDPQARRRGLLWFAAGHAVVFCVVLVQRIAIWDSGLADWVLQLLIVIILVLLYLWFTAEGEFRGRGITLISLFGSKARPSTERLRSQYEQQIREAAGQEERNRLARDLHDSIKQQVFVIQTAAATAQVRFDGDPEGAKVALEQVRDSAREAMAEMEAMLDQLRAAPLENAGLVEALKKQCEALGFRTGAQVEFKLGKLPPSEALAPGAQQTIFRVGQEALANIGRHARAKNVTVALDAVRGRFELRIRDDGAGFDTNQASTGMGIANMRARAEEFGGEFELASRPGDGTSVSYSIPYAIETSSEYRQRALTYGAVLVFCIVFFILTKASGAALAGAALASIGLARQTSAYWRMRKQRGTSQ
jgi:signal transduction histidine kinase